MSASRLPHRPPPRPCSRCDISSAEEGGTAALGSLQRISQKAPNVASHGMMVIKQLQHTASTFLPSAGCSFTCPWAQFPPTSCRVLGGVGKASASGGGDRGAGGGEAAADGTLRFRSVTAARPPSSPGGLSEAQTPFQNSEQSTTDWIWMAATLAPRSTILLF